MSLFISLIVAREMVAMKPTLVLFAGSWQYIEDNSVSKLFELPALEDTARVLKILQVLIC
jgi:hypothetical protein